MSEMVERVAEAIQIGAECHLMWKDLSQDDAERYRYQARAAIKAMRKPSEAMAYAGFEQLDRELAAECWRAMINAALA